MRRRGTGVLAGLAVLAALAAWRLSTAPDDGAALPAPAPRATTGPATVATVAAASAPSLAPAPIPGAAAASRPLGPEGYAPQIRRAIESASASEAAEAVELMNSCRYSVDIEAALRGSHPWVSRPLLPAPQLAQVIESLRLHQQHCQTITSDLFAQREALAQRALAGQWPGAAQLLAELQAESGPRDEARERAEFMEALMQAIQRGSRASP